MKQLYIFLLMAVTALAPLSGQSADKKITKSKIQSSVDQLSLKWATYYPSHIRSIALDSKGNTIVAGETYSNAEIPAPGAFSPYFGGNDAHMSGITSCSGGDVFISKFDPSGNRLWSTYFGGVNFEMLSGLCIDSNDNIIISGLTESIADIAFGKVSQTTLCMDWNYFVAKFNSDGSILWSSYIGCESNESLHYLNNLLSGDTRHNGGSVCVDSYSNIYFLGISTPQTGFATKGAFKFAPEGYDALICKFSPAGTKLWATYYGGDSDDFGLDIKCDISNNLIIAGATFSSIGLATTKSFQSVNNKKQDWFLAKFDDMGNRIWGTYLGGSGFDHDIKLSLNRDNIYIVGETASKDLPVTKNCQKWDSCSYSYLSGFNAAGDMIFGTYFAGLADLVTIESVPNWNFRSNSIAVDSLENIYVAGSAKYANNLASAGAFKQNPDKEDAFICVFDKKGQRLAGTYFGGENDDNCSGIAVGNDGSIHIAGETHSNNKIATAGAHRTQFELGKLDSYIAKFQYSPVPRISSDTALIEHFPACAGTIWQNKASVQNFGNGILVLNMDLAKFTNNTPGLSLDFTNNTVSLGKNEVFPINISYNYSGNFQQRVFDTLLIPHNDYSSVNNPLRIAIDIVPDSISLSVNKNEIVFGSTPSCLQLTDSITYTNNTPCDIIITDIPRFSGDNPEDFSYVSGPALPDTLRQGMKATFTIRFSPAINNTGTRRATAQISSTTGLVIIPKISLSGISSPMLIVSDLNSLDFGSIPIETKGVRQYKITNNSSYPINISKALFDDPNLKISPANITLAPNASQIFDFEWTPSVAGNLSDKIDFIVDSPCLDTVSVIATGKATDGKVTSTSEIDFGILAWCETKTGTIIVTNNYGNAIDVMSMTIEGPNKEAFSVVQPDGLPITLDPNNSWTSTVNYDGSKLPEGKFTANAIIKILINTVEIELTTQLRAENVQFHQKPEKLDFPLTSINKTTTLKFAYKNIEKLPVTIVKADLINYPGVYQINPVPDNLKVMPGDSAIFDITFSPVQSKTYYDTLRFDLMMQSCRELYNVALSGAENLVANLKIYVTLPDTSAIVGDNICIPVYGRTESGLAVGTFDTEIQMANNIFEPVIPYIRSLSDLRVSLNSAVSLNEHDIKIAEICGQVLMAQNITYPLIFNSFVFHGPNAEIIMKNGSLTISGACMPNLKGLTILAPLKLSIKPNPASDMINVSLSSVKDNKISISIVDVLGKTLWTDNIISNGEDNFSIDASDFGSGIYCLTANSYYGSGNCMIQVVK